MDRPTLTVGDIFRRDGDASRHAAGCALATAHRRVMAAIESCRTAVLGGHVEPCDRRGHTRVWYNSCRHRHGPSCQSLARAAWIDDRTAPSQTPQTMTLDASEFIRRVLVHVWPAGFHRMRDDGWLGHRHRTDTRARCRQLLGTTVAPPITGEIRPPADYRDRYASLTGISLRACPLCADGHMILTDALLRARPALTDTS